MGLTVAPSATYPSSWPEPPRAREAVSNIEQPQKKIEGFACP